MTKFFTSIVGKACSICRGLPLGIFAICLLITFLLVPLTKADAMNALISVRMDALNANKKKKSDSELAISALRDGYRVIAPLGALALKLLIGVGIALWTDLDSIPNISKSYWGIPLDGKVLEMSFAKDAHNYGTLIMFFILMVINVFYVTVIAKYDILDADLINFVIIVGIFGIAVYMRLIFTFYWIIMRALDFMVYFYYTTINQKTSSEQLDKKIAQARNRYKGALKYTEKKKAEKEAQKNKKKSRK